MRPEFSDRLKLLREERNLGASELAEALGVYPNAISRWESTAITPSLEKLIKIADYFGVSLDFLAGRSDSRKCTR